MENINRNEIEKQLNEVIYLHEKMKGAYFFKPPCNAASRRLYEEKNSLITLFSFENNEYKVMQTTNCSCNNIYYKMSIFENDQLTNKDIRFIKKVLRLSV